MTGDFNLDTLKSATCQKITDICQHFGLEQLISEPTHYTENSSSLIDLVFTSDKNSILASGVGEPFLEQNLRYHCPIFFVLKSHKITTPVFRRHIWLYDRGDYRHFSRDLQETEWVALRDNDIDIYAQNITNHVLILAEKHVPNKNITVRQTDPPWLTNDIKKMMRKRQRIYKKFKITKNNADFEEYKKIRNKITASIRKSKQNQTDKLADKLKNNDLGPKDWWKTLKQFIKPNHYSSIPPLNKDDAIYTEESDKATIMNAFFAGQSVLNETNATLPPVIPRRQHELNTLFTTPQEVQSILSSLPLGKAAGPDSINNRILKEIGRAHV